MQRAILFLLATRCTGCMPREPVYRPVATIIATEKGPVVIHLRSGERLVLDDPRVHRDTVAGTEGPAKAPRRVAVTDVTSITRSYPQLDPMEGVASGFAAGLLAGLGALLGLVLFNLASQ